MEKIFCFRVKLRFVIYDFNTLNEESILANDLTNLNRRKENEMKIKNKKLLTFSFETWCDILCL